MKAKRKSSAGNLRQKRSKKPSYPKAMTIRYNLLQEQDIQELMLTMEQKTMTKALLAAPNVIKEQNLKCLSLEKQIGLQREKIYELQDIVTHWTGFQNRLDEFLNKGDENAEHI